MSEISEAGVIEFIRASVKNAGAEGVVVGLSGGIDSAVATYLAKQALGSERVMALLLPESGVTPAEDLADARALATALGLKFREIDIAPLVKCYMDQLQGEDARRIVRGNLKARVRMTLLYWHANQRNLLVLGTGNKTEIMLGYSTKYGDAAADILPLAGLYKRDVRALAERLGVPGSIRGKSPSAGLWHGQTDEDEMGISYQDADGILEGLERGRSKEDLIASFGSAKVNLVMDRIRKSQHKRGLPAQPPLPQQI